MGDEPPQVESALAGVALLKDAFCEQTMGPSMASRADEAVGPAQLENDRAAQLLGAVEVLEFGLR